MTEWTIETVRQETTDHLRHVLQHHQRMTELDDPWCWPEPGTEDYPPAQLVRRVLQERGVLRPVKKRKPR